MSSPTRRHADIELFVVYSDARDTHDTGLPPPILNRSVVVKVTKLFRF